MTEDRFAHLYTARVRGVQPSAIREICKLAERPSMKSLAGGWPDPATFPSERFREIITDLLAEKPDKILQYGTTEGVPAFREEMARWAEREWGIECHPDQILVLHGSQQGMDLACRVFVEPGDVVLAGLPTYFGGTGAVSARGGEVAGVPVDDLGMNTDAMAEILARLADQGRKIKGLYVIPNFQNPTGSTLPLSRREKILELAKQHDFMIFEDDPYRDLRFEGEPQPTLGALDAEGRVIHIHSFSKIFSPGMRLGVLIGEMGAVRKMAIAKQFIDACTNTFAQYVALEFLRRGYLKEQIAANAGFYRKKRDRMLALLDEHFPDEVQWNRPQGGFFIWASLPEGMDAGSLCYEALDNDVAFVAGKPFFADGGGANTFRLSYSQASLDDMEAAVAKLGAMLRDRFAESRQASR